LNALRAEGIQNIKETDVAIENLLINLKEKPMNFKKKIVPPLKDGMKKLK
jgi:hypothetical protein